MHPASETDEMGTCFPGMGTCLRMENKKTVPLLIPSGTVYCFSLESQWGKSLSFTGLRHSFLICRIKPQASCPQSSNSARAVGRCALGTGNGADDGSRGLCRTRRRLPLTLRLPGVSSIPLTSLEGVERMSGRSVLVPPRQCQSCLVKLLLSSS